MKSERPENDEAVSSGRRSSARSGSGVPARKASPKLLASVAARLRELERAASDAASELRGHALETHQHQQSPRGRSDQLAGAVLHELILTLSERADALEHEAELIAGVLERARHAILHPEDARRPRTLPLPGRARLTTGDAGPRPAKASAASRRAREPKPAGKGAGPKQTSDQRRAVDEPESPPSAGVKLLAVQMALDGQSRDAIQVRLQEEFGVDDPASAVKEVLEGATRS